MGAKSAELINTASSRERLTVFGHHVFAIPVVLIIDHCCIEKLVDPMVASFGSISIYFSRAVPMSDFRTPTGIQPVELVIFSPYLPQIFPVHAFASRNRAFSPIKIGILRAIRFFGVLGWGLDGALYCFSSVKTGAKVRSHK